MVKSVQDVVRGMRLPPGYNFEALQQLADITDHQQAELERLRHIESAALVMVKRGFDDAGKAVLLDALHTSDKETPK